MHAKQFTFLSVAQRAAALDVAVGRQVKDGHELGAAPRAGGDHACFFAQELATLLDIDGSRDFGDFAREVYGLTKTMPLLLLHKDAVVEAFLKHLGKDRTMAWRSLLHLLAVLGRCVPVLPGSHATPVHTATCTCFTETCAKSCTHTSSHYFLC